MSRIHSSAKRRTQRPLRQRPAGAGAGGHPFNGANIPAIFQHLLGGAGGAGGAAAVAADAAAYAAAAVNGGGAVGGESDEDGEGEEEDEFFVAPADAAMSQIHHEEEDDDDDEEEEEGENEDEQEEEAVLSARDAAALLASPNCTHAASFTIHRSCLQYSSRSNKFRRLGMCARQKCGPERRRHSAICYSTLATRSGKRVKTEID